MNKGAKPRQLTTLYPISGIIARQTTPIPVLKKPRGSGDPLPLPCQTLRGFAFFFPEISR